MLLEFELASFLDTGPLEAICGYGQAQLDVDGEAATNWHTKLDVAIFSSQEVLSLHFSFKLGVTIQITLKFSYTERKS